MKLQPKHFVSFNEFLKVKEPSKALRKRRRQNPLFTGFKNSLSILVNTSLILQDTKSCNLCRMRFFIAYKITP